MEETRTRYSTRNTHHLGPLSEATFPRTENTEAWSCNIPRGLCPSLEGDGLWGHQQQEQPSADSARFSHPFSEPQVCTGTRTSAQETAADQMTDEAVETGMVVKSELGWPAQRSASSGTLRSGSRNVGWVGSGDRSCSD